MIWNVHEGLTGILTLSSDGTEESFIPDYDQDEARELLLEFQELKDEAGSSLKSNYHAVGFNWYPSMVSFLYWYLFFPAVKYAPLLRDWMDGRRSFVFKNGGQFRTLLGLFDGSSRHRSTGNRVHHLLLRLHNRFAARKSAELLFFRFARKDFRTEEIRKTLGQLGVSSLDVIPAPPIRQLLASLFKRDREYFYSQPPTMGRGNRFKNRYPLLHLNEFKRRLFESAISAVECSITSFIVEYRHHLKALRRCTAKVFYGLDDVNGYVFPVLYASRTLGLRTIGHQHGAYVRRHAGYMMEGIDAVDFRWFDRVIVWGKFWKEKMGRSSKAYPPDFFIVGSNKFSVIPESSPPPNTPPRTVLIPYEFLADTAAVGQYIEKLVACGYQVLFKGRPDDPIEEQLRSYCLSNACAKQVEVFVKLDAASLDRIDIVAGTMTTLLYELLPCRKIVWYLDTAFRHLEDLVDEGLAHRIFLDDIRPPGQMDPAKLMPIGVDRAHLFGETPLQEVIRMNVAPGTSV